MNDELHEQIQLIRERNRKVELEKTWEISLFRKVVIAILTYLIVLIFFLVLKLPKPVVNAFIPTIGFLLSTLSLGICKKIWLKYFHKSK